MTNKYRKKPIVIEAMLFDGLNTEDILDWVEPYFDSYDSPLDIGGTVIDPSLSELSYFTIETLEGTMRGEPGDWIIRGVKGEFYPCKPDIFEQTYELVTDDDSKR